MELVAHLAKAREAAKTAAERRKATQVFQFHWRSSESEYIVGWASACALLGMKENSLAVRLSASKNSYVIKRTNPLTGEPDILTISRVSFDKAKKALRGRPPKQVDLERLGTEYAPLAWASADWQKYKKS